MADYLAIQNIRDIQESELIELFPELKDIKVQYSDFYNWNPKERIINIPHLDSKISLLITIHEFAHVSFETEESEEEMQLLIDGLRKKFDVKQYEKLCEILAEREVRALEFALREVLNRFKAAYPKVNVRLSDEEIEEIRLHLESYYDAPTYVIGLRESRVLAS